MANQKIKGNVILDILPSEISKRFTNNISYTATLNSLKWVYRSGITIDTTTDIIFTDNDQFIQFDSANPSELDADVDEVYWIYIKHTGYEDTNKVVTTKKGVIFTFTDTAPDFASTGASTSMLLMPNECTFFRVPKVPADNFKFRSCRISNDSHLSTPAGNTVCIEVAALIRDSA